MKENIYDNKQFFQEYSQMSRSVHGLEGAGEWHCLQALIPNVEQSKVLDLGCGYGWHAKYLADHGASNVVAVDLSKRMIEKAITINNHQVIDYQVNAIEDLEFEAASFDFIISSLTLHYIADYQQLITNVYNWLTDDGKFLFSCEHPIFTASGNQDWVYDQEGKIKHFAVDNYSYEGKRNPAFLGTEVTKYHRTLATYLNGLIKAGFTIDAVMEPTPPESMLSIPGMSDESRRPMMMIILVSKNYN